VCTDSGSGGTAECAAPNGTVVTAHRLPQNCSCRSARSTAQKGSDVIGTGCATVRQCGECHGQGGKPGRSLFEYTAVRRRLGDVQMVHGSGVGFSPQRQKWRFMRYQRWRRSPRLRL
jgi:hypothetical protein